MGDWVNESQAAVVATTCRWAKGGNFLDREFTMKTEGQPVLSGTQRIGWDPLKRQFKTWIFDSEGGHGEGYFTHTGNQWVVKVEGVGQDGTTRVGHKHHHATGQGPHELAVDRKDRRRLRGPRSRRVHDRAQATRSGQVTPRAVHRKIYLSTRISIMIRTLSKLAIGVALGLVSLTSDVLAGRGGGYGGGGRGGYGGGGRGGYGGQMPGGSMGHSPAMSQPHPQSNSSGSYGNHSQYGNQGSSNHPAGAAAAGAGYANRNQSSQYPHAGAAGAAAGAGYANRNQGAYPNAGAAAGGAAAGAGVRQ